MDASGGGISQPALPKLSTITSRRWRYIARISWMQSSGPLSARRRGHLNGRIGAVIEVGFHARECREQALVAHREAHAPAAMENVFDMEVNSTVTSIAPGHLQHGGRRLGIVEIDLGIGEIREQDQLMLLREGHEIAVEIEIRHIGRGVRRIADHQRDRLRHGMHHRALKRREHRGRRLSRHGADDAARHQEAEGVIG